jgi:hypothetical protein
MRRGRFGIIVGVLAAALLGAAAVFAADQAVPPPSGVEGRVIFDGLVFPDTRVFAYRTFDDLLAFSPAAISGPSGDDGKFQMDLPPGSWILVAKRRAGGTGDGPLAVGDLLCYHGSNPIIVAPGGYTHVGFFLVRKEREVIYEPGPDEGSGSIAGTVLYEGDPLPGADVQLYLEAKDNFRGQVFSASPATGKTAAFRMDLLPESTFFVIARKRASGAGAGPLGDGDYFGYFIENPVTVKAGKIARIDLAAGSKAGEIGKDDSLFRVSGTTVKGRVTDAAGAVAKGVYAFAYREKVMSHRRPSVISKEVDEKGNYALHLPEGGTWYIGARSSYGEGPTMGEWYGRYDATADHGLTLATGATVSGVDIVVERIAP